MKGKKPAKARAKARRKSHIKTHAKAKRTKSQARRPMARSTHADDSIAAMVTAGAQALGIPLDPAWRASVAFNLRLILSHGAKVDGFPLPDDAEPAPIFHA